MNVVRVCRGNILIFKKCNQCGRYFKAEDFHKHSSRDGRRPECKYCRQNNPKNISRRRIYEKTEKRVLRRNERRRLYIESLNEEELRAYKEKRKTIHDKWVDKKTREFLEDIKISQNLDKEPYGVIYYVYNNITKKYYVGQTRRGFDIRYRGNFLNYQINIHQNKEIKNDFELYGETSFEYNKNFKIAYSEEELNNLELYYINFFDSYKNGYNRNRGFNHIRN